MGFQFLGIPPKGEQLSIQLTPCSCYPKFPISRDPPEGGTHNRAWLCLTLWSCFQFLGIPPKGEPLVFQFMERWVVRFQFLGIPPKGEHSQMDPLNEAVPILFPISRDPPEGGTT